MIYKYLQSVAALPIDDLTDLQVSEQFASLKQDLLEKNNSYVTAMLSRNIELWKNFEMNSRETNICRIS